MDSQTLRDLLDFVGDSTANSLDPLVRQLYKAERERLAEVLKTEVRRSNLTGLLLWTYEAS